MDRQDSTQPIIIPGYIRTMRIGLDVHVLTGPHQGTVSVWANLLNELPANHEYVLYSFDPDALARRYPQSHFIHRGIPRLPAVARIQLAFPLMARRDHCDVFHANYYGPLIGGPPLILNVHDLIYLDFPEYSTGIRRALFNTLTRASAYAATYVVTGSFWARERILSRFSLPEDKVQVVASGLDNSWLSPDERAIEQAWAQLSAKASHRYALSVGRLDPRKNFAASARVVRDLIRRNELDGLVIVGPEDFGATRLRDELTRDGTIDIVTLLSDLSQASLQALYRHASCLLYLSLAEGFGLPLIEAMAMGTPIVASDRTSVPEVVGDAGLIVDPSDLARAAEAVSLIIRDDDTRRKLVSKGHQRVQQYTTAAAARQIAALYETAARQ